MSASRIMSNVGSAPAFAIYTREERARRDATRWTTVQAVLAPVQFAVFLVSCGLVVHALATGRDVAIADASVLLKALVLLAIMATGAIWEKRVFGRYLLAPAFFWEDMVSFAVVFLHACYVAVLLTGFAAPTGALVVALVAYAAYCANATQFVLKFRHARREACA